jgi:hypothetical protein
MKVNMEVLTDGGWDYDDTANTWYGLEKSSVNREGNGVGMQAIRQTTVWVMHIMTDSTSFRPKSIIEFPLKLLRSPIPCLAGITVPILLHKQTTAASFLKVWLWQQ